MKKIETDLYRLVQRHAVWRKFEDKLAAVYIQQKYVDSSTFITVKKYPCRALHAMELGKDRMITLS